MRTRAAFLLLLMAFGAVGVVAARQSPASEQFAPTRQQELGQAVYQGRCEICHGAEGDGNGPASLSMSPRPRDFRRGWYKIRTTASGQLPTNDDLVRVITLGMPGTTMPAWGEVLSEAEILSVAEYLKTFSRRFEREAPEAVAIAAAPGSSDERIGRGAQFFSGAQAECIKCHGEAGRGDGPSASELADDFGEPILPADLSMPWLFRGGPSAQDIYLRLKTGLTGSPMPSYAEVLSDDELWDLAYYVDFLSEDLAPAPVPFILARKVEGSLPSSADDDAWERAEQSYYPLAGQVMREPRNFTPRIQGIWVRALHNGSEVALRLEWHDRFVDRGEVFDALAVQFPAELLENDERPYFVFGEAGKPVNLWVWEAGSNSIQEQNGEGVGTRAAQSSQDLTGQAEFEAGAYTLVVKRSLTTGNGEDLQIPQGQFIPIAFAAWDGASGEVGEAGSIGSWQLLYLEQPASPLRYLWIPAAVVGAAALEWLIARTVRKSAQNTRAR